MTTLDTAHPQLEHTLSSVNKIHLSSEEHLEQLLLLSLQNRELPGHFAVLCESGVDNCLRLNRSAAFPAPSALAELLRANLPQIVRRLPDSLEIVSVGVLDSQIEALLLNALLQRGLRGYIPVSPSSRMVDAALSGVQHIDVQKTGFVGLIEDLPRIRAHWHIPVLLSLLGGRFCDYEPDDFLPVISSQLSPGDRFLFDCLLFPTPAEGRARWRDAIQKQPPSQDYFQYNIGPVVDRGLCPDDCRLSLRLASVSTLFGNAFQTRAQIELLTDTSIEIAGQKLPFAAGETIVAASSYRYSLFQVIWHLRRNAFRVIESFLDPDGLSVLVLATKEY